MKKKTIQSLIRNFVKMIDRPTRGEKLTSISWILIQQLFLLFMSTITEVVITNKTYPYAQSMMRRSISDFETASPTDTRLLLFHTAKA